MKKILLLLMLCLPCLVGWGYIGETVAVGGGDLYEDITYYHNADSTGDAKKSIGSATLSVSNTEICTGDPAAGTGSWCEHATNDWGNVISYTDNFDFDNGRLGFYFKRDAGATESKYIVRNNDGAVNVRVYLATTDSVKIFYKGLDSEFAVGISDNNWHHIEVVFSGGSSMALYTDNVLMGSITGASGTLDLTGVRLPSTSGTQPFQFDQIMGANSSYVGSLYDIKDITTISD